MTSKLAHALEALDDQHHDNLVVGVVLRIENIPTVDLSVQSPSVSNFPT